MMLRQKRLILSGGHVSLSDRDMPAGTGLLIALTLGLSGWWGILVAVRWIAG